MDPVRDSYDTVAHAYGEHVAGELPGKPVDRAMYGLFADLVRADLDADSAVGAGAGPPVGDVGCGPGHVTAHLATLGLDPVGVDLSPGMVGEARRRYPSMRFHVGSMLEPGGLAEPDGGWAGAVAAYSIVHFGRPERVRAFTEIGRVVRPRGWLLVSFHIDDDGHRAGDASRVDQWWGHPVELTFLFLDPVDVTADLAAAGFTLWARTDRAPWPGVEQPTRRCHLLARRAQ